MKTSLLLGAAALLLSALPAFADDLPGDIKTMTIDGKTVLTDAKGMTLYTYDKDASGGPATCADKCASAWPPALASADAKPVGDFTVTKSADGKPMWAYYGLPLYGWVKDKKPGDATGDMVGNVWHTAIEK